MLKKISTFLIIALSLGFLSFSNAIASQNAIAASPDDFNQICNSGDISDTQKEAAGCNTNKTANTVVGPIINVAIGLIGVVAVIMIIIGALTFTTSAGDPAKTKKGRDIILYSVIGLVVALLAYAIVTFVLQRFE